MHLPGELLDSKSRALCLNRRLIEFCHLLEGSGVSGSNCQVSNFLFSENDFDPAQHTENLKRKIIRSMKRRPSKGKRSP